MSLSNISQDKMQLVSQQQADAVTVAPLVDTTTL
jgi:hypothetical protein